MERSLPDTTIRVGLDSEAALSYNGEKQGGGAMNDKRPETFDELFEPGNLYDRITERGDKLIDKLMDTDNATLPLIRIYSQRDSTDKVFDFLENWVGNYGTENRVTEFSDNPPSVSFRLKNGATVFSDYICIEYFRLYMIEEENLKRYTYFEIYYDDYIVTCLMDSSTFRKVGAMERLDMDTQEWAYAKMQMKIWNQAIYPELWELGRDSALLQRIEEYHGLMEFDEMWRQRAEPAFAYDAAMGDIWAALAYLCSFQILERLPQRYLPQYAINFVCSNDYFCQLFSDKLTAILSDLFKDDYYIKGNIPLHSDYKQSKARFFSPYYARPYILRIQRISSVRDLLTALDHLSHIRKDKKKWSKHPFRYDVPICVSDKEIVDSAVVNINMENHVIESIPADDYPMPSLIRFFRSLRREKNGEVKCCKRNKIEKWLNDAEEAVITAFPDSDQKKYMERHASMFQLSIIFLVIHGFQLRDHELPDNARSWFEELLKAWKKQDAILKSAVKQVLIMVAEDAENVLPGFPKDKEDLMQDFDGICRKDALLLYHHERLKEKISELRFSLSTRDILNRFDERKFLKTNKNDLTYSVKIGGKTTRFYAFYLDSLKEML